MQHKNQRDRDLIRMRHMLEESLRARRFAAHLTWEQFSSNEVVQYATFDPSS
jgi:hypothetical protein